MNTNTIQNIPLEKIVHNRFQQVGVKDEAKVLEIVTSLKANENNGTKGLLQVPTARATADGCYELAFGHHRYYAFDHLKNVKGDLFFSEMPLIVRELTDIEMFELMAIENFHRRDIGVMEEANTLHSYMTTFNKTSVEAAQKFEKTEEYVRGAIRLLNLPEPAQQALKDGKVTKSQARNLLVLDKLGGAELVQEAIDEIGPDSDAVLSSDSIEDVMRMSSKTIFLDKDDGWFSSKKFPVKHLPELTQKDLVEMIHFDESWSVGVPINVIKEIMTLIAAGMEVTDNAFPMILPDDLERVRVLVNPPRCEACPLHAVLDGTHYCGLPICKKRKQQAWKTKELENKIKQIGVPLYQKSDGPFVHLTHYNDDDQKLWKAKGADLRLMVAEHMWNNFDGLNENLRVVLVGDAAVKRLKKQESAGKSGDTERSKAHQEGLLRDLKRKYLERFEWEVVSLAFKDVMDGCTNFSLLLFQVENIFDDVSFPDDIDEDELIKEAQKAKKSDGLNTLRRMIMFSIVERAQVNKFNFMEVVTAKKPVLAYAADFQKIADEWEVKLPKDFSKQAEQYQAELDAAIKEIGKA